MYVFVLSFPVICIPLGIHFLSFFCFIFVYLNLYIFIHHPRGRGLCWYPCVLHPITLCQGDLGTWTPEYRGNIGMPICQKKSDAGVILYNHGYTFWFLHSPLSFNPLSSSNPLIFPIPLRRSPDIWDGYTFFVFLRPLLFLYTLAYTFSQWGFRGYSALFHGERYRMPHKGTQRGKGIIEVLTKGCWKRGIG